MSARPRLLDLFCGAGGAAMGYHRAGFDVVGVDIKPQPHYPFPFILGDAIDVLRRMSNGERFLASDGRWYGIADFVAIHASPPCQAYTLMRGLNRRSKIDHPKLIEPTREILLCSGRPYIIENVIGAPLKNTVMLCGSMFGLNVRRHRIFETNFFSLAMKCNHYGTLPTPVWGDGRPTRAEARKKLRPIAVYGDHPQHPGDKTYNVNRAKTLLEGQEAMGIDWMIWSELTQAVPPAYTEFIGRQLMTILDNS